MSTLRGNYLNDIIKRIYLYELLGCDVKFAEEVLLKLNLSCLQLDLPSLMQHSAPVKQLLPEMC